MTEPRTLRPVPDPLGSYIRPGYHDHGAVLQSLVEGKSIGTGLIAEPCWTSRRTDMLAEARRRGVQTVSDTHSVDLSTDGGFARGHAHELPWAAAQPHTADDLRAAGAAFIRLIVDAVEAGQFSAVLAPTHHLAQVRDPWLAVDAQLTRTLRNRRGGVTRLRRGRRRRIRDHILRRREPGKHVHPSQTRREVVLTPATSLPSRNWGVSCAGSGQGVFSRRGMRAAHGCQNGNCCPRGWQDMQLEPRRHFLIRRAAEIAAISAAPESLRSGYYMENFLRPASDRAVRAAEVEPSLVSGRKRLDSWRGTLGAELDKRSPFTVSPPAAGKRLRRSA